MKYTLLTIILISCWFKTTCQNLHNNGAVISIKAETVLSTGFSFNNSGTVINNGSINVSGQWLNKGTYEEADGEVVFNGATEQDIDHSSQSFKKLKLRGGGTKSFLSDITIIEELTLEDGVLAAESDARLILDDNASVTGGFDNAYVIGTIVHRGTGSKIFPIGTANAYLPVELTNVTGDAPEIAFTVTEPNLNTDFDGSLDGISPNQYWTLELLSGTYAGSTIKLSILEEDFLQSINNMVVAQAEDLNDAFSSIGRSLTDGDINNGSVTSKDFGFGPIFTLGSAPEISSDLDITVINAVSPNGDGIHDFLKVQNITAFPENTLTIFNRWGDRVFEANGYDNVNNIFEGITNINGASELPDGTYFYTIENINGGKSKSGFIEIRR